MNETKKLYCLSTWEIAGCGDSALLLALIYLSSQTILQVNFLGNYKILFKSRNNTLCIFGRKENEEKRKA